MMVVSGWFGIGLTSFLFYSYLIISIFISFYQRVMDVRKLQAFVTAPTDKLPRHLE